MLLLWKYNGILYSILDDTDTLDNASFELY